MVVLNTFHMWTNSASTKVHRCNVYVLAFSGSNPTSEQVYLSETHPPGFEMEIFKFLFLQDKIV